MENLKEMTGLKFGKLTVISIKRIPGKCDIYWECLCDCGNKRDIKGTTLRSGRSKSCGCNLNQSKILKFKRENPNATPKEIMKERIKAHTKWNGECLEWTATLSNGYGTFVHNKKCINASRAAWISEHGEIPKGLCVLHHCDNRRCCRVSHMFLGTHKTNTEDMVRKGRDNWQTMRKFPIGTREKVWALRQSGKMYREICKIMDLSMDQVKSLLQNQKRHLNT